MDSLPVPQAGGLKLRCQGAAPHLKAGGRTFLTSRVFCGPECALARDRVTLLSASDFTRLLLSILFSLFLRLS